tara:strand:+ start:3299 stop:5110 length:1812 start_codon:yes stop_codon:yes gene_type:complete
MTPKCFDMQILIPPPPPKQYRIAELELIKKQYKERFNPEFLQDILDKSIPKVYHALLKSYGIEISLESIKTLIREVRPYVFEHKDFFKSLRPYQLAEAEGVTFRSDKLNTAQSFSYPSGHTTEAYYIAFVLSEDHQEIESQLFLVADMIAQARIDRGVHFPSDNDGGIMLAKRLFDMRKKSNNSDAIVYSELLNIANELDKRGLFYISDTIDSIVKTSMPLSEKEQAQLGTSKDNSQFDYIDEERWNTLRESLVSKKPSRSYVETDSFKYDPELTAYTPGETLSLLSNPKIQSWFSKIKDFKIPEEYKHIILVPCAASKPWGVSCPSTGKYYKAYHDIKKDLSEKGVKAYWVTISEPLGIVPEDMWDSFPGYDVPGLFKDPSSRMSGMTTKQWKEMFGKKYAPPFDQEAYDKAIELLGEVIANFILNNNTPDRRWISFIKGTKGKVTTHTGMINEANKFIQESGSSWNHSEHTKEVDALGHPTKSRIYEHIHGVLGKELTSKPDSLYGYKMVAHKDGKYYSLARPEIEYSLALNEEKEFKSGFYLGTDKQFVLDYYSELTDDDHEDALLTYLYRAEDVISGDPKSTSGEVTVSKAVLIGIDIQ